MTVKAWLMRGKHLDDEIHALLEEQRKAFESATGVVPSADGERVQTTRRNSVDDRLANFAAYSAAIDERIDRLYAVKMEIISAIAKVADPTLRTLLTLRYINFHTWERIAEEMNYSKMQVYRLHGRALQTMKGVIECYIGSVV